MNLNDLKKPFDTKVISWRVGATNIDRKTGKLIWGEVPMGIPLAYIDARDVMERLDEVCEPLNWQAEYPFKGCCRLGIKIEDEWVWKSNGAGETEVEADKGQYSDALKRAAVLWGVGRYLYDVQNFWIELEKKGRTHVIKNPGDARLIGALEKAAAGVRVAADTPPLLDTYQVDAETWLISTLQNIEEFVAAPQSNTTTLISKSAKTRLDPMWEKLNDGQVKDYEEAIKAAEFKLKQKEKENA